LTACDWTKLADPIHPRRTKMDPSFPLERMYDHDFKNGCDAKNYDFSAPIFQTPIGVKLKELITETVKLDPKDRLSLSLVLVKLEDIKQLSLQQDEHFIKDIHYAHANDTTTRFHLFKAKMQDVKNQGHPGLTGDKLKAAILSDFKKSLLDVGTTSELYEIVAQFKKTEDYKILEKSQGLFGLKHGSLLAFHDIIEEMEVQIRGSNKPKR